MADFDPDAYLAATEPTPTATPEFDPDEYLKATAPKPKTGVEAATSYGQTLGAPTIEEQTKMVEAIPEPIRKPLEAAAETVSGFIPKTPKEIAGFATPVVGAIETIASTPKKLSDVLFGGKSVAEAFPESQLLAEAERTPAFSKERYKAGFEVLGTLGMGAAIGRGLIQPKLSETLGFEKPETPLPTASELTPEVAAVNEGLAKLEQRPSELQNPRFNLLGSRGRGDATATSDYDVSTKLTPEEYQAWVNTPEGDFPNIPQDIKNAAFAGHDVFIETPEGHAYKVEPHPVYEGNHVVVERVSQIEKNLLSQGKKPQGVPNAIQEPVSTQPYGVRAEPQVPQETQAPAASVGSERVPEIGQRTEVPGGPGQEVAPDTESGPVSAVRQENLGTKPVRVGDEVEYATPLAGVGTHDAGRVVHAFEGYAVIERPDGMRINADWSTVRKKRSEQTGSGPVSLDWDTKPTTTKEAVGRGKQFDSWREEHAAEGKEMRQLIDKGYEQGQNDVVNAWGEKYNDLIESFETTASFDPKKASNVLPQALNELRTAVKSDTGTQPVSKPEAEPKLLPGEKQGDLISSTQQEPFALVGEKAAPGTHPTEIAETTAKTQAFGLPSEYALGVTHPAPNFIKSIADYFVNNSPSQIWNGIKGSLDATLGKTFAKTTIADRGSGELGAKWISSRIAAPHLADTFSAQVLEGTGVDPVKFGAALTEDNLRSVRASAETPEAAANVTSVIGAKNSPFKTEAEYQSFLNDPATQTALEKHRALWEETVDPMFRKAQSLDPDEPLPTRGEQTGARINLFNDIEGRGKNIVSGGRAGSLTSTMRRKSPFAIRATGSGQNYNVNYNDMMSNTFGRQLEIANKNAFEDRLVETGNAVISKPGPAPVLPDGEATVGFPLKRKASSVFTNAEGQPQTVPINQNIYVRKSLAGEYRRGADVDLIHVPGVVKAFNNVVNKTALAGLTDASVHVLNLGTALFTRPGVVGSVLSDSLLSAFGRADIPVTITKTLVKSFKDNRAQMAQLAEIGAGRGEFPTHNPLGKVIQVADKTTRLVLDDAYQNMVKQGWVTDTPTNRREFVNQVGQYNKRAQGDLRRLARDSGLGPFATAGTTFNVLGLRTMGLSPGVKATSPMAAAALRANVLSKWVGAATFVGAMNYLLTKDKGGGVSGRPGVPLGRLDTGLNDKNGNPLSVPVFDLMGLGRGLRVTGARGFIESQRKGLTLQNSFDAAARDVFNSSISPFAGPPVRFGIVAATGSQPAINVGRVSKVVPPGESQSQENLKQAIIDANPVVKSVELAREPGQGMGAAIRQQLPRLSLLPSQGADFIAKYPEIVRKAQARDYVNDVIRRARRMNPEDKQAFLDESLKKLAPEDQKNAIRTFKYSRVMGNTPKLNVGAAPYDVNP